MSVTALEVTPQTVDPVQAPVPRPQPRAWPWALLVAAVACAAFVQSTTYGFAYDDMISDLRNLATAQEAFYADSTRYAGSYSSTLGSNSVNFSPSQNNVMSESWGIVSAGGNLRSVVDTVTYGRTSGTSRVILRTLIACY